MKPLLVRYQLKLPSFFQELVVVIQMPLFHT